MPRKKPTKRPHNQKRKKEKGRRLRYLRQQRKKNVKIRCRNNRKTARGLNVKGGVSAKPGRGKQKVGSLVSGYHVEEVPGGGGGRKRKKKDEIWTRRGSCKKKDCSCSRRVVVE